MSILQSCTVPGYLQREVPKTCCKYSHEITQTSLESITVLPGFQIFNGYVILGLMAPNFVSALA